MVTRITACGWAVALALALGPATEIHADSYRLVPEETTIGFRIRHLGIDTVDGRFGEFEGVLTWDGSPETLEACARVGVGSVETGNRRRDDLLQDEAYFHAARFPDIEFVARGMAPGGSGWILEGDLTIRGTTRPIGLSLGEGPRIADDTGALYVRATGALDRTDFGIRPAGMANRLIGREVEIDVEIVAAPVDSVGMDGRGPSVTAPWVARPPSGLLRGIGG